MRALPRTLSACLLLASASCSTTPRVSSPVPTPALDELERSAKCPKPPPEILTIPPVPVFETTDSWPAWAKKLYDWGIVEWKDLKSRTDWDAAHPGC